MIRTCRHCQEKYEKNGSYTCSPFCAYFYVVKPDMTNNDCWIWPKRVKNGYAILRWCRDEYQAHRVGHGAMFDKNVFGVLRNTCGNTACVRGNHWAEVNPCEEAG